MHEAGVGSFEQARERALDMPLDSVAYYNVHLFWESCCMEMRQGYVSIIKMR